jgi:membrane associated rhomboid family serine protease
VSADDAQPGRDAATAPVCYRHPGRETYVRCARCERPICPDCMNPASVGFQCPNCVREGSRTARPARTVFGGAAASGERGLVTKALLGTNVGLWLVTVVITLASGQIPVSEFGRFLAFGASTPITNDFGALPALRLPDGTAIDGIASGEYYRLLTAGFLHYGLLHLALNMYALWILGRECERLLGQWRFVVLYLVTGLGGNVAVYLFAATNGAVVGASGSIFGLFGALFFFFRKLRVDVRGLVGLIVANLLLSVFIAAISLSAHVGGLLVGALYGLVLAYAPKGQLRTPVQIGGAVAILAVLAVLVAVRTAALA